jgi:hypothetical protein
MHSTADVTSSGKSLRRPNKVPYSKEYYNEDGIDSGR